MNKARKSTTATTKLTEAEAIEGVKRGDSECFEFLYELHKRRVYSICLRITRDKGEAEEFTQDAFLQLYRKISSFRGDSTFSTWLRRLVINIALMNLRKKRLTLVPLDDTVETGDEEGPRKEYGSEDQALTGSIDRVNLERAIRKLPSGYRTIVELHDVEGFGHEEIAEITGCSVVNSKLQLVDARMQLRGILKLSGKSTPPIPIRGCRTPHPWM